MLRERFMKSIGYCNYYCMDVYNNVLVGISCETSLSVGDVVETPKENKHIKKCYICMGKLR